MTIARQGTSVMDRLCIDTLRAIVYRRRRARAEWSPRGSYGHGPHGVYGVDTVSSPCSRRPIVAGP